MIKKQIDETWDRIDLDSNAIYERMGDSVSIKGVYVASAMPTYLNNTGAVHLYEIVNDSLVTFFEATSPLVLDDALESDSFGSSVFLTDNNSPDKLYVSI